MQFQRDLCGWADFTTFLHSSMKINREVHIESMLIFRNTGCKRLKCTIPILDLKPSCLDLLTVSNRSMDRVQTGYN